MPAIAMVIQHGADTCEFAANLASDLGYEVLDYRPMELSLAASFRPGWHRFGAWLRAPSRRSQPTHPAAAALRGLHEQCLEALRSRHVLLVAWSAVLALPPNQAVIRVLLHAPRETRLAQLAERQARQNGSRCGAALRPDGAANDSLPGVPAWARVECAAPVRSHHRCYPMHSTHLQRAPSIVARNDSICGRRHGTAGGSRSKRLLSQAGRVCRPDIRGPRPGARGSHGRAIA